MFYAPEDYGDRSLQIQVGGGPGAMYVDTMFIGANMTEAEERTLAELA